MSTDKNNNKDNNKHGNDENHKKWEEEKKKAADFWSNFLDNLMKFKAEREKNDPVYQYETILFSVNTGTFQHDFEYDEEVLAKLKPIMENASYADFEATRNAFLQWKSSYEAKLKTKEPERKDFFSGANFQKAHNDWLWEKTDAYDFALSFGATLDDIQKQKINADPKYQPTNIVFSCVALGVSFKDGINIHQKDLLQYSVTQLADALTELSNDESLFMQIFATKEPKQDDFFFPQNYIDATKEWQNNKDAYAKFANRVNKALGKAIKTLSQQQQQQQAQQNQPQQNANTAAPIVDIPQDFPNDPDSLKIVKRLGGSTGAELVEAPDGTRYVRKRGNNEGHIRSECYADAFYRAAGADVPEFRLYDTSNGPVKLSRYYEGTQSLDDWWKKATKKEKDAMSAELRKQYATDVLLGNWDVVGMGADNILIDKNGKPWRIDNGGALSYRAQGAVKNHDQWGDGFVDDLWTMTGNGQRIGNNAPSNLPTYFGQVDVGEMAKDINSRDWSAALTRLPIAERAVVERRLEEVRQLAAREEDFRTNGYTREYTLSILDETYKYSKMGLREACTFSCDLNHGDFGWFRPKSLLGNSTLPNDNYMQSEILMAVKTINKHNAPNADKQPTFAYIQDAYNWEQKLKDALVQGYPNAQHYLDIIQQIKDAYANQTTIPQVDVNLPVWSAGNQNATQAQPQNTPNGIAQQMSCLSEFLRDELGDRAVDAIEKRNDKQGVNSYTTESCRTKFLRLRAQGFDLADPKYPDFASLYNDLMAQNVGYYLGDPNGSRAGSYSPGTQYDNLGKAFNYYKQQQKAYDQQYQEMTKYNAALQIAMENSDFTNNDHSTRTVILMRTESKGVVTTKTIGKKSNHLRGVNESHSIIKTVGIAGHDLTMVRVPYSRINGFYMMKAGPKFMNSMFAGDGENEVSADTHGLPIYYMGNVQSGLDVSGFIQDFLQYEQNNP